MLGQNFIAENNLYEILFQQNKMDMIFLLRDERIGNQFLTCNWFGVGFMELWFPFCGFYVSLENGCTLLDIYTIIIKCGRYNQFRWSAQLVENVAFMWNVEGSGHFPCY